ncbi:MAG: NAD(P)/FAD-dependent oxidoreductase [bacterium]|nr:NAD(P)/FAD-dependent oxidoreductase [bacterium]
MAERRTEVLVIGAGPAGLAAAAAAAACGRRVLLVDDNADPGGQIWRGEGRAHLAVPARFEVRCGVRVVDACGASAVLAESAGGVERLTFDRLVLATGARERFLPFPGWTLPNVVGAGGLQAMVKGGVPIAGKRVVIAGSGPLLLAVAAYLRSRGARSLLIAEQTGRLRLARFVLGLAGAPQRLRQTLELRRALAGVPLLTDAWPLSAHGAGRLEEIRLRTRRGERGERCDLLACGFGLVPNTELAALLGCRVEAGCVAVDEHQATSVAGVYAAGEMTGIGGLDLSRIEGEIAGYAAGGDERKARAGLGPRRRARRFARALERAFALREELRELPDARTLLCRCEDVSVGRAARYPSWRAAKLHTRCGMGACQGRICGAAAAFLFGWRCEHARPPASPARIATLAAQHEV